MTETDWAFALRDDVDDLRADLEELREQHIALNEWAVKVVEIVNVKSRPPPLPMHAYRDRLREVELYAEKMSRDRDETIRAFGADLLQIIRGDS